MYFPKPNYVAQRKVEMQTEIKFTTHIPFESIFKEQLNHSLQN